MTPEQLSQLILGGVGVALQLAFKYLPKFKDWYGAQANKGLIALAFNVGFGAVYFGFACVPFLAEALNISLACSYHGAFVLVQAIFIIAMAQQGTYLFTRKK